MGCLMNSLMNKHDEIDLQNIEKLISAGHSKKALEWNYLIAKN